MILRLKNTPSTDLKDLIVVVGIIVASFTISVTFKPDLFVSMLMYLFLPSLYLILRKKKDILRISVASLTMGVFYGMSYNFVAEYFHAYQTIYKYPFLAYKIVGVTPVADIIWGFMIPFSIFVFYEHFLDRHKPLKVFSKRNEIFIIFGAFLLTLISFWLTFYESESRVENKAYFIVGLLSCLPLILIFLEKHTLILKIFYCSVFYVFVNTLFEISAIHNEHWVFPGDYIHTFSVNGFILPLEEVVFWIIPSTSVFIILYEFFFDDNS